MQQASQAVQLSEFSVFVKFSIIFVPSIIFRTFKELTYLCSLRILRSFHSIPTGATDANDA